MNQITNLSQQKPNLNDFRNLAFEVSCHLDQLAAFMLQASSIEEYEDEIKAKYMAQAVSKTSLILFQKTISVLEDMESIFKSQELVEFRNNLVCVEGAVLAISESDLTSKHQCNYFYGVFHVIKEMEKEINDIDLEAEEAGKEKSNG
ncbi:hypothetical protein [Acinetobacter baumannii]|uniref:hypothetical protein n=1 Tax=Acinetobacter baumannii TaxID=470 RepID=UPI00259E517A|nr:hypothetical protein [Acinetobacter baumannii]EKV7755878.1 hypothetical protein [Acinetobacter baumannii]EKW8716815.1 hypothetical protein [Acinetobacter baumannii]ELB7299295.1 hypothetical protein [Acinetobacter baumannii]ELH1392371.1 hypothetical protein [Acinetobacter baumannii]ELH1443974.1 hypothetical protein [Acinetobacter baumannii]